jgi:hemoglobin
MKWAALAASLVLGMSACKSKHAATGPAAGSDMAAGSGSAMADAKKTPLFDRLGGKDAITAVVEDFVGNVAADERINAFFANADIPHLKQMLVDQICEASGGPCKYTGKNMVEAHTGMKVKDTDFGALVEDLVKSLDKYKVPEAEKNELLGALGGMKPDIVGH